MLGLVQQPTLSIENVSEPKLHTGRAANTVHIENGSKPQLHTGGRATSIVH